MDCSGLSSPISTMPDCSDCMTSAPEQRPGDGADAAGQRRAADHRRGDDVELVERAQRIGRGIEARRRDRRGDGAERAHQHEDLDRHPARIDAGQFRRFGIAAHGEDVAAEAGARGDEGHDDADAERDQHRDGDAVRDEQAAFGHGDAIGLGVVLGDAARPGIGIGDPDGADGQRRSR